MASPHPLAKLCWVHSTNINIFHCRWRPPSTPTGSGATKMFQMFQILHHFSDPETICHTFLGHMLEWNLAAPTSLEVTESFSRHWNMFILFLGTQHNVERAMWERQSAQIGRDVNLSHFFAFGDRKCDTISLAASLIWLLPNWQKSWILLNFCYILFSKLI